MAEDSQHGRAAARRRTEPPQNPPPKATPSWRVLGSAVILLALGALLHDALRSPQVQAPTSTADQPFRLHFRLKNPSLLFTMAGLRLTCITNDAALEQELHLRDITSALSASFDLQPGASIGYACPFDRVITGLGRPQEMTVSLKGSFRILGLSRPFESGQFHWASDDPVWKEWIAAK